MTRRIPVIVVAVALLLTVAFWFLLYKPRDAEQARYNDEAAQLESQATQLQAQITSLLEVRDNAEDYRSQLVRLAEYIPEGPAQPEALRELQRIADQSGVEIIEMTYADPEIVPDAPETGDPGTTLAAIPTQMVVEGGYFQVVDLLRRVEVDMNRAIKIETVSMDEAEEEFPQIAVTWTGQVFALLDTEDALGADGQVVTPEQPTEAATESATEAPADDGATEGTAPDGTAPDGTAPDGTAPTAGDGEAGTS